MKNKYLLIGLVVVALVVGGYLVFYRKKDDNDIQDKNSLEIAAMSYTGDLGEIENTPTDTKGKPKTLVSKERFEAKVRAQILDILSKPDWVQSIDEMRADHYSNVEGASLPEAIYIRARNFIANLYYWQPE